MSKRTADAVSLFERASSSIPTGRIHALVGNIYRSEGNFTEAIRLHQQAHRIEERNVEVLLEWRKSGGARRYERALQTLQDILRIEPDNLDSADPQTRPPIRLEKWSDALEIQHRLVKANLPESERRAEANLLLGCMYEVGRQLLEGAIPTRLVAISEARSKKTAPFCQLISASERILVGRVKPRTPSKSQEDLREDPQHHHLHRLEELFLELGEPTKSSAPTRRRFSKIPTTR